MFLVFAHLHPNPSILPHPSTSTSKSKSELKPDFAERSLMNKFTLVICLIIRPSMFDVFYEISPSKVNSKVSWLVGSWWMIFRKLLTFLQKYSGKQFTFLISLPLKTLLHFKFHLRQQNNLLLTWLSNISIIWNNSHSLSVFAIPNLIFIQIETIKYLYLLITIHRSILFIRMWDMNFV